MIFGAQNLLAALSLGLCVLLPNAGGTLPAEEPVAGTVLLSCLVYRIDGEDLVAQVEALTSSSSNAHEAVAELLRSAKGGASRLARVHCPVEIGNRVAYTSSAQVPIVTVNQGQFSTQQSFGGYQNAGTQLNFQCIEIEGAISTAFSIEIESFVPDESGAGVSPPPREQVSLQGSVSAASGVTRMFQLDAGNRKGGTLVVFVTTTKI